MPQNSRGNGAPGPPRITDGGKCLLGRDRGKMFDGAQGRLQGQVPAGPDVGPSQSHQKIDIGRPGTDAFYVDQGGASVSIREMMQSVQRQLPLGDGIRHVIAVSKFLSRQARAFDLRPVYLAEACCGKRYYDGGKTVVHGQGGCQGHLLLQNDVHQGSEAGFAAPHGWRSVAVDDHGEIGVAGPQDLQAVLE